MSFDVRLAPGSTLDIGLGLAQAPIVLRRGAGALPSLGLGQRSYVLSKPRGWLGGGWRHVEAIGAHLAIDGRSFPFPFSAGRRGARTLTLRAARGRVDVAALILSAGSDRGWLLLHRLAELHARIQPRRFPLGADIGDRIHDGSTYWTSGFWPGALWQAAGVAPAGGMFARWALRATIGHFGQERSDTHDVGFMYGESSLAAWRALCRRGRAPVALCARLKRSVLSAAGELLALAASNGGAGTIPTNATSPQADTIIDSTMNIAILTWASRVTGDPAYARLASRHAHVVASLLVRGDGSTVQSVNFDRATGRVLFLSTHQGLSAASTWSRGQGWAVYGFAQTASDLHDRGLLTVAQRAASYVARHLPPGGIPLWDYDAPAGAPVDVSAGAITAAGLLRLAAACHSMPGACPRPGRWVALARRMLSAALARASDQPPIGLLGSQILNERGRGCWCDGGELIFGVTYALEAVGLVDHG